jgi:hypothetical protein
LGNVALPMVLAGIPSAEWQIRAKEALESVGLSDRVHHRPNQLSAESTLGWITSTSPDCPRHHHATVASVGR